MSSSKQQTMARERRTSRVGDPYRRTPLACKRCQKRKTKCSGEIPICRTCRSGGHECVYLKHETKVPVPEWYLRDLEARLKAFENGALSGASPRSTSGITSSPSNHDVGGGAEAEADADGFDDNPLTEGVAHLVITPSGQRHYLGNSASASSVLRLRNLVENLQPDRPDLAIEEFQFPTYNPAAWPTRRPSITTLPHLPPFDFAKCLYAAQYAYIGTIFSFVSPSVFEERLQQAYTRTPDLADREACLAYCEVLLIFAYGQLYSVNQWDGHDGPPGFDYFMQALQFLPDIHEEGSILFVEVLSLVGYFMQNLNRRDAAFLYIGLALRMAISLGLHQEISDPALDDHAREHRRRLWWSVYSMDRILCAKSGNPITILDEDIGVLPPSRMPDIEPEISSATVLLHYTELSRILGKIMNTIYRKSPKTGSTLVTSVCNIMTDLNNWRRDLPLPLHFDTQRLNRDISREQVSTFLHFYQCINMTARPLLFHVVQKRLANGGKDKEKDWRTGLSPATTAVIEACVNAARDSTTMMHCAAKQNLVATYGFMDGEHIFSAAIVLVMINLAFPFNEADHAAMVMALDVLRGMAEKGNGHVRARHQLLLKLRNMASGAPDAIAPASTQTAVESTDLPVEDAPATGPTAPIGLPSAPFPTLVDDASLHGICALDDGTIDAGLWEEGYGNFDVDVDFDWTQWTEAAQATFVGENGPRFP
ncbi:C6 transcription factor [Saccharata proteae CBS 121410]|uniref:C6 transcription factor n=1 Tax=Saccharata proteae CBS 121410 TaxID=1314787 RepID=A0A6A5YFH5_9PEZI|nr:C6 transcription factor [Saccharata proteae CBS 121410]